MPNNNRVMLTDVVLFYMLMIQKQTRLRWRKGEKRRRKRRIAAQRNSEIIAMVEKKKKYSTFLEFQVFAIFLYSERKMLSSICPRIPLEYQIEYTYLCCIVILKN